MGNATQFDAYINSFKIQELLVPFDCPQVVMATAGLFLELAKGSACDSSKLLASQVTGR